MFHLLLLLLRKPPHLQSHDQRVKSIRVRAHSTINIEEAIESILTTKGADAEIPLLSPPPSVRKEGKVKSLSIIAGRSLLQRLPKSSCCRSKQYLNTLELLFRVRGKCELLQLLTHQTPVPRMAY